MGTPPGPSPSDHDLRGGLASSVFVHHVTAETVDKFIEIQDGVRRAARDFPGHQAAEVYPPPAAARGEWVIVLHFADHAALQNWLDSPERAEWVERFRSEIGEFRLKTLPTGFGAWFAGLADEPKKDLPPAWKMVMMVVLGLYPTVVLLTFTVGEITGPLGFAVSLLIGNVCSVSILQWVVMPVLTRVFGPWLHANAPAQRAKSAAGVALILSLYGALAVLTHFIARAVQG